MISKEPIFESLKASKMAHLIAGAQRRVLLAAPGVHVVVADALITAGERLGHSNLLVAIDCDENVLRMGYGDIDAVLRLRKAALIVRQSSGFRSAVLICDDRGWVFTPTALYLEDEPQSDETPNALRLSSEQVQAIAIRLSPQELDAAIGAAPTPHERSRLEQITTEVGLEPVSERRLWDVAASLKVAPPVSFEIARQVRVFQPYIQYVEMNLVGCAIERHRVEIPRSIQRLGASKEIEGRLRTTFDLIKKGSELSSKALENDLREIRDNFTRSLGRPWGRVLLRAARPLLDKRLEALGKKLEEHKEAVKENLEKHIQSARQDVMNYYAPLVEKNPPDELAGQIMSAAPGKELIHAWLRKQLDQVFPKADELIQDMRMEVQFRDVTYETLNEQGFGEALRNAYPHVDWNKPFAEFTALQERQTKPQSAKDGVR